MINTPSAFFALLMAAHSFLLGAAALAQDDHAELARKKAQVIYSLALFVTWPDNCFSHVDDNFRICLLGETSPTLRQALSELGTQKSIRGHAIEFFEPQHPSEQQSCHIAFVGAVAEQQLDSLLEQLHQHSILSISDRPDFAELGGIVGLLQIKQRVRFGINLDAAATAKLSIRAQLLVMSGTSLLGKNVPNTSRPQ